jgi:transcription initiation factor TFIIIB Brf1 subunit/transcription initiation factor TFIIB
MENVEIKNNPQSVKFVPAVCPKCGGQLDVDPSQEAAVCKYCGTPFVVDKAIQNYTIQNAHIDHADKVTVDLKGSVDSVIGLVERELDKNREDRREENREFNENSKEFMKNSWKMMLVLFGVLIVVWVIANALGIFN